MILFAIGGAVILGALVWVVWPGQGLGVVWNSAPGGPLPFRIRLNSVIPKVLGSDGTSLFGVVHIRRKTVSPYLLAHETGHCLRARGHWFGYLWKYLTSKAFHDAEEEACEAFGLAHRNDPFIANLADRLRVS